MARNYNRDDNDFSHIGIPFNYTRGNPLPVDNTSVWSTKAAAEAYAKNSPVAYVGQILTVNENGKVSVWKIENTAGDLIRVDGAGINAYNTIKRLRKYLYKLRYDSLDYNKAYAYFRENFHNFEPTTQAPLLMGSHAPFIRGGGCSSARCGNFYGRNLDWYYDHGADFAILTPADTGRHAVVGFVGAMPNFDDKLASEHRYTELFDVLPFCLVDGMNDAGLVVNTNIVPLGDYGDTTGTKPGAEIELCGTMVPRYLLDHFSTADEAVAFLRDTCSVYRPNQKAGTFNVEMHYMIADRTKTYVVEFVHNETKVTDVSAHPWMTNFYVYGVEFNEDGTVDYTSEGLTPHAEGIERNNIIAQNISTANSMIGMYRLMADKIRYTRAYSMTEPQKWLTEYTGDYTGTEWGDMTIERLINEPEVFEQLHAKYATQVFPTRTRDVKNTWHTEHTTIYDIASRKMWLSVQESGIQEVFTFDFEDEDFKANHLSDHTSVWIVNSTDPSLSRTALRSRILDNGTLGWVSEDGKTYLSIYKDRCWKLVTPNGETELGNDLAAVQLAANDYPSAGEMTILFKQESTTPNGSLTSRAETNDLSNRVGLVFYNLTPEDATFETDVEYYARRHGEMYLAVEGEDYTVGDTIPHGDFYLKVTDKDLTSQVNDAIDVDACSITLGGKTLVLYPKSTVDNLIQTERERAQQVEQNLISRVEALEAK